MTKPNGKKHVVAVALAILGIGLLCCTSSCLAEDDQGVAPAVASADTPAVAPAAAPSAVRFALMSSPDQVAPLFYPGYAIVWGFSHGMRD